MTVDFKQEYNQQSHDPYLLNEKEMRSALLLNITGQAKRIVRTLKVKFPENMDCSAYICARLFSERHTMCGFIYQEVAPEFAQIKHLKDGSKVFFINDWSAWMRSEIDWHTTSKKSVSADVVKILKAAYTSLQHSDEDSFRSLLHKLG